MKIKQGALIFLRTYPAAPLFFYALNYPAVPFFFRTTLLCHYLALRSLLTLLYPYFFCAGFLSFVPSLLIGCRTKNRVINTDVVGGSDKPSRPDLADESSKPLGPDIVDDDSRNINESVGKCQIQKPVERVTL